MCAFRVPLRPPRCGDAAAPVPSSPGSWYYFLQILGYLAVFTNLGVIVFTGNHAFFNLESAHSKLIAFVAVEVSCLACTPAVAPFLTGRGRLLARAARGVLLEDWRRLRHS